MSGPLPDVPLFAADDFDPNRLEDAATRDFAVNLRRDGVAEIDLGDEGRVLCEQTIAETEPRFRGRVSRVQDAWFASPSVKALALHLLIVHRPKRFS